MDEKVEVQHPELRHQNPGPVAPDREEIPFPVVTSFSHVVVLQFAEERHRNLFKQWLTKEGGWAAFGDFIDSHSEMQLDRIANRR